jgi:hypothetical protein
MSKRVFIDRNACTVWISLDDDGSLVLEGQDLDPRIPDLDEYEYCITVKPEHFEALRGALDAPPYTDIIEAMCANAETIFAKGETTCLGAIAHPRRAALSPRVTGWTVGVPRRQGRGRRDA